MRILLPLLLALSLLAGCSKKEEGAATAMSREAPPAEAPAADVAGGSGAAAAAPRLLAYEHSVRMDVQESEIGAIHEAARAACEKAVAEQCVILESRLDSGGLNSYANLKVRATADGVKKVIAAISSKGDIVMQSTTAEDLATPIQDAGKKLDMLLDYRKKLEGLRERASSNIESLISVNKELAAVQSDIEAISGEKAQLMHRVQTELLTISIRSFTNRSFMAPVSDALGNFGSHMATGTGAAISAVAFLTPWAILLALLGWGGRMAWIGLRRKKA